MNRKYFSNGLCVWSELGDGHCFSIRPAYGSEPPRILIHDPKVFFDPEYKAPAEPTEITKQEFLKEFDKAMNYFIGVATKK